MHGPGGEPDLVADEPRAPLDLVLRHCGRDGVGILDGDVRIGDRELHRLLFLLLGGQQRFDAFTAFGFGQRHGFPYFRNADSTLPRIAGILRRRQTTSKRPAAPMPPPMHMVTTTCFAPRRLPSISAWPVSRDPVRP